MRIIAMQVYGTVAFDWHTKEKKSLNSRFCLQGINTMTLLELKRLLSAGQKCIKCTRFNAIFRKVDTGVQLCLLAQM